MRTMPLVIACSLMVSTVSTNAQTVLYWHPSSGSNQDIDDMVDDMENAGATVTSTTVEENFYKG
jgi:predicted lactoylglutathione lyase